MSNWYRGSSTIGTESQIALDEAFDLQINASEKYQKEGNTWLQLYGDQLRMRLLWREEEWNGGEVLEASPSHRVAPALYVGSVVLRLSILVEHCVECAPRLAAWLCLDA